jgi:hypothetical protein
VDAQITFVSDSEGKVTHAIHQQNGSKLEARKLVEKPIAAVDPKIYQDYKGEYQLQPGAIITVSTEDDKLYIQVTGQPKLEIFPSSETEYFLKVVNAQIQFIRDADNKVNELKLFQNGMQFLAPRIK